jgi:hypothetical protein
VLTCVIVCACISKTKVGQNVFLISIQYTVEDGFVIYDNSVW